MSLIGMGLGKGVRQAKDPVALKNAYRQLFEAIVVGDIGQDGKTDLKFVLRGQNLGPFIDSVKGGKKSGLEQKWLRRRDSNPRPSG